MKKKIFTYLIIVGLAISTVAIAGSYLDSAFNIENAEININIPEAINNIGEEILGAIWPESQNDMATSTTDAAQMGSISIWDSLRFGDNPRTNNNYVNKKFFYKGCTDATTTVFALQNEEGKTIYMDEVFIELQTVPTSTLQMFMGTSTQNYLVDVADHAAQRAISDPTNSITALMDNILVTDGGYLDATSTIFSSYAYTPASHGYGTNIHDIPITPGSWAIIYASTTDADGDGAEIVSGDFDCAVWGFYRVMDMN